MKKLTIFNQYKESVKSFLLLKINAKADNIIENVVRRLARQKG